MATEQPSFMLLKSFDQFEVREYPPLLVAETIVQDRREEAGNQGFRRLAGYIFGGNRGSKSIAMTAPVTQTAGQKIAMTAPVSQTAMAADRWVIQFTMPSGYTLETLPVPLDERVKLRAVPRRRVAVHRYSGRWSETLYVRELTTLRAALTKAGLRARGEATWARYDPPWVPWFLRTNEIQLEVGDAWAPDERCCHVNDQLNRRSPLWSRGRWNEGRRHGCGVRHLAPGTSSFKEQPRIRPGSEAHLHKHIERVPSRR